MANELWLKHFGNSKLDQRRISLKYNLIHLSHDSAI